MSGQDIEKVIASKDSFSLHDAIENCVEIIATMLSRPAKFKLVKLGQHMSAIAYRYSTKYGEIWHS